jgi:hypothetical protein
MNSGHRNFEAGLERRQLGNAAAGRIAATPGSV